jgi:hypothetical protein
MVTFMATIAAISAGDNMDKDFLWAIIVANETLAIHSYTLLNQVPLSTRIIPGFMAPHREAFKRTIAMMHYTNLRLIGNRYSQPSPIYKILIAIVWWQFLPLNSDWSNGNTWVFVVPIFVGVSLDILQSMLLKDFCGHDQDLVSWRWLLGVHLSAMIMAFGFTMAFRNIIIIQQIYFGAAFFVALLICVGCWLISSNPLNKICSFGTMLE